MGIPVVTHIGRERSMKEERMPSGHRIHLQQYCLQVVIHARINEAFTQKCSFYIGLGLKKFCTSIPSENNCCRRNAFLYKRGKSNPNMSWCVNWYG